MKPLLRVINAGIFSSLQDKGRFGYRSFGVPTAGPMDKRSFQLGNQILCNDENDAALEIFYGGMTLESLSTHEYVLVGAIMKATVNGETIDNWKTFILHEGDLLKIEMSREGSIAYLFPSGGFVGEEILNSLSTSLPANIGKEINTGDILYGKNEPPSKYRRGLYQTFIPKIEKIPTVRVVPSYHLNYFEEKSIKQFFQSNYKLTSGNRMGYFLEGPTMIRKDKFDLLSEPTMFGTIQIPPNGQPIVLMADAQTVGGYPMVGKIMEEDLWKVAQLRYGDEIKFIKENINVEGTIND